MGVVAVGCVHGIGVAVDRSSSPQHATSHAASDASVRHVARSTTVSEGLYRVEHCSLQACCSRRKTWVHTAVQAAQHCKRRETLWKVESYLDHTKFVSRCLPARNNDQHHPKANTAGYAPNRPHQEPAMHRFLLVSLHRNTWHDTSEQL